MISFVNAKINIGLQVVRRREDGYHDLQTVFYPVGCYAGLPDNPEPFCDIIEIIDRHSFGSEFSGQYKIHLSGRRLECDDDKNLVTKAVRLYFENFVTDLFKVEVFFEKHLPDGAGMGGGSADAAFVLKVLRELHLRYCLNMPDNPNDRPGVPGQGELAQLASKIGADCPFFLLNRPSYATGIGDCLQPLSLDLSGNWLVVVKPGVSISTAQAFAGITPRKADFDLRLIADIDIKDWRKVVKNDFEVPFFKTYPEMQAIKDAFYKEGALFASLTGSGSCLYGIFDSCETASKMQNLFRSYPTIQATYLLKL